MLMPPVRVVDRALLWEKDNNGTYSLTINDFGKVESYFFDTNESNLIVGRNIDALEFDKPLYLENGVVTGLAELGGDGGTARGVNESGQIVGYVDSDGILDGVLNS